MLTACRPAFVDPEEEKEQFRNDSKSLYSHGSALSTATMHLFGGSPSEETSNAISLKPWITHRRLLQRLRGTRGQHGSPPTVMCQQR
jgi:hypothetical protein